MLLLMVCCPDDDESLAGLFASALLGTAAELVARVLAALKGLLVLTEMDMRTYKAHPCMPFAISAQLASCKPSLAGNSMEYIYPHTYLMLMLMLSPLSRSLVIASS
jgi:hypothetical protein